MGCSRDRWLRAALKELIDNGLDAAEEAGIAPEVAVKLDGQTLTVRDNGPGMPEELVERLCDRTQRTSSREAFAAPTRGAQGNAIQTLMCLPLAYGMPGGIVIASGGVEHVVTLCRSTAWQAESISTAPPARSRSRRGPRSP
jgi:DNA topoisomerase-6 subunit B